MFRSNGLYLKEKKMKLNKLIYGFVTIAILGQSLTACTDEVAFGDAALDEPTQAEITEDTVFNNAEYTRQFLVAIYSYQYYGLPFVNNSKLRHHYNPYAGKCDALTDCWHMGWEASAIYGQYYNNQLTSSTSRDDGLDGPLYSFTKESTWESIRAGNKFLEKIDNVPGFENDERARLKAECKCLIAAKFWDAFQRYGGLPIVDKALGTDEASGQFPRRSVEDCVEYMVGLLDDAIKEPNFPWVTSDPSSMWGRWTKAGAMALKAKILQFAASPLLNPKDGKPYYDGVSEDVKPLIMYTDASKYQERWDRFYDACKAFFDALDANGYYELTQPTAKTASAYRLAYRKGYALNTSKEILHMTRVQGYDSYTTGRYCWHSWYTSSVPRNLYWPTQEYVEKFSWSDGTPFNYQTAYNLTYKDGTPDAPGDLKLTSGNPTSNPRSLNGMFTSGTQSALSQYLINVAYNRDPRLYEECFVNSQRKNLDWTTGAVSGDIWELWYGGTDALDGIKNQSGMTGTGYGYTKYYMGNGTTASGDNQRYGTHWVYLSLNEMYLNYAEALIMKSNPDVTAAVNAINVVRNRVGVGSFAKNFASTHPTYKSRSAAAAATAVIDLENGDQTTEFMEELLNERVRELGLQDIRWYDMIRYKRTDWMTKQLHALEMHRLKKDGNGVWTETDTQWTGGDKYVNGVADMSSTQPRYFSYKIVDIFTNKRAQWGKDPKSNDIRRWLFTPFPLSEINKGYGLIQNPGW